MKLADRVALVTGAGSGIGRATALLLAEEGAHVVVNDVDAAAAGKTVEEMGAAAGRARAIVADVADSAQVNRMFAEVGREFGVLDVLVNNAGIGEAGPGDRRRLDDVLQARLAEMLSGEGVRTPLEVTERMSDETWRRMLAVHLDGTFFCTRAALPLMTRPTGGSIVNLSSVAALAGLPLAPHYSAAKGGILAFTRALAQEVGFRKIRVNAVCPGFIDTPMTRPIPELLRTLTVGRTPLGRWGEPREIAATILFLASDDASFLTGQWISPNGGLFIG
jgi:3-oxoacyl-[acyl-carrier protein] reductase